MEHQDFCTIIIFFKMGETQHDRDQLFCKNVSEKTRNYLKDRLDLFVI